MWVLKPKWYSYGASIEDIVWEELIGPIVSKASSEQRKVGWLPLVKQGVTVDTFIDSMFELLIDSKSRVILCVNAY